MKKAFLILCLLGVPIFGYGASTNVSDLPLKTAPIANDSAIINDTQDINATTGRSESKRALLGSLPVSTAQQAAIDLKANKAGAVLLWSEWANGATFTTASPMVVYNGTLYKCIAPYVKVSGETPDTQTGYFSEVIGGSSVSVPVATADVSGTVKIGDRLTMTNGVLSAEVQSGTGAVDSVNAKTGAVVITPDDLTDTSTANKFVSAAEKTKLANLSGTNTGDQTTVTGNAGTATALQTARTIGGVSFDGTANINLPGVNATGNQNTTGTAAGITAQYVDWNSSAGGSSIANKPSISGLATSSITGNLTIAKTGTTARTATFPDKAGTVAFTSDVPTGTAASVNTGTTVGTIPVFGDDGSGNPTQQYTLSWFDMIDAAGNPINPPSTTGYIPSVSTSGAVTWVAPGTGGATNLDGLSDVVISGTPTTNYVLKFNGTNWVPAADATAAGAGYVSTPPTYSDELCTAGQYARAAGYRFDCLADGTGWDRTATTTWSNPTPVYNDFTLTIAGWAPGDVLNFMGENRTASAVIPTLNSATTPLTCTPGPGRACLCEATVGTTITGTAPDYVVDMSGGDEAGICTLSANGACTAGTGNNWTNTLETDYWNLTAAQLNYQPIVNTSGDKVICNIRSKMAGNAATGHFEVWSDDSRVGTQYGSDSEIVSINSTYTDRNFTFAVNPSVPGNGTFYLHFIVDSGADGINVNSGISGDNVYFGESVTNGIFSGVSHNTDFNLTISYVQ